MLGLEYWCCKNTKISLDGMAHETLLQRSGVWCTSFLRTIVLSLYITIYVLANYMAQKGPSKKQHLSSSTAIDHSFPFLPTQVDVGSAFMVLCLYPLVLASFYSAPKDAVFAILPSYRSRCHARFDAKWHLPILTCSFILTCQARFPYGKILNHDIQWPSPAWFHESTSSIQT